jgi:hypothetical protein
MIGRYGADPLLRDEDGKLAIEKARERSTQDHRHVVDILEHPEVYGPIARY